MDTLKSMRHFMVVVEAGGFSQAARRLGMSVSAIWRHVNALEYHWKVRLLNRNGSHVSLTEEGRLMFEGAKQIVDNIDSLSELLISTKERPTGVLHVNSRVSIGRRIMHIMPEFLRKYPDISVEFTLDDATVDLNKKAIDVDIRAGRRGEGTGTVKEISRRVLHSAAFLFASPSYLKSLASPLQHPQDIAHLHCLGYRTDDGPIVWIFQRGQQKIQIHIEPTYISNNAEALRLAAIDGCGLAVLSDWAVAEDIRQGRLVRLLDQYNVSTRSFQEGVFLIYRSSPRVPKKIRVFVDFIAEKAKSGKLIQSD